MSNVLLQVYNPWREHLVAKLDFYLEQADSRLISQFGDSEGEAEIYGEEVYDRLGATLDAERYDEGDAADMAQHKIIERYEMLSDMRRDVHLSEACVNAGGNKIILGRLPRD